MRQFVISKFKRAMQYASKYDLLETIINAIETGNIMKITEIQNWPWIILKISLGMQVYYYMVV